MNTSAILALLRKRQGGVRFAKKLIRAQLQAHGSVFVKTKKRRWGDGNSTFTDDAWMRANVKNYSWGEWGKAGGGRGTTTGTTGTKNGKRNCGNLRGGFALPSPRPAA
jgi:hypothetical protein